MELFMAGQLKASYDKFDKVLALVPVKSKVGRRTMCVGSQGKLYCSTCVTRRRLYTVLVPVKGRNRGEHCTCDMVLCLSLM